MVIFTLVPYVTVCWVSLIAKVSWGRWFETIWISYFSSNFCLLIFSIHWWIHIHFISFPRIFVINIWLSKIKLSPQRNKDQLTLKPCCISVTPAFVYPNFQRLNTTEVFLPSVGISGCVGGFLSCNNSRTQVKLFILK